MPEPSMRDLERHLIRLATGQARLEAEVAKLNAELGGNQKILNANVEELTVAVDHLRDVSAATNQILTGVRSQGNSSYDIAIALSRRFRLLVQRLVERGVIALEALKEDELETRGVSAEQAEQKLRAVDEAPP